jgi:hypothetical protein
VKPFTACKTTGHAPGIAILHQILPISQIDKNYIYIYIFSATARMSDNESNRGGTSSWKIKTQLKGIANYELWLEDLEVLWEDRDLLDWIEEGKDCPVIGEKKSPDTEDIYNADGVKKWKKKDTKVKRSIRNNCEETVLIRLSGCRTSKELRARAQEAYGLMGFTIIQGFLHVVSHLKDAEHADVETTIASFHKADRGLQTMGVPLPNVHRISFFIDAFEDTYNQWHTKKRAELTKMMEKKEKGADFGDDVLGEMIRELTDHASRTPRDLKRHSVNMTNAGDRKSPRKFNSWREITMMVMGALTSVIGASLNWAALAMAISSRIASRKTLRSGLLLTQHTRHQAPLHQENSFRIREVQRTTTRNMSPFTMSRRKAVTATRRLRPP